MIISNFIQHLKQTFRFGAFIVLCILTAINADIIKAQNQPSETTFKATTIFLVRHAEKATTPTDDPSLLEIGQIRAEELAKILTKSQIKAIYTSHLLRTKQTATPIAQKLGITPISIIIPKTPDGIEIFVKETVEKILEKQGETILVVGHSNTIPETIKALGGDIIPEINDTDYDNLFILTIYAKGKAKVTTIKYGK